MKNVPRPKLLKQRAIFTMIRPTVEELRVKVHNSRVTLYYSSKSNFLSQPGECASQKNYCAPNRPQNHWFKFKVQEKSKKIAANDNPELPEAMNHANGVAKTALVFGQLKQNYRSCQGLDGEGQADNNHHRDHQCKVVDEVMTYKGKGSDATKCTGSKLDCVHVQSVKEVSHQRPSE